MGMKIEKVEIKVNTRQLTDKLSVDPVSDITVAEIEDSLFEKISKEIQEELDFEIVTEMLLPTGWVEIHLNRQPREETLRIINWCKSSNIPVHNWGRRWLFKEEKHANMFILRWGSD